MSDEKPYDLSETKEEQIRKAYISSNYAGATRLYELMHDKGSRITKAEVRAFIDEQLSEQIFQRPKVQRKKDQGSLTSLYPNETFQIDIFDLSNSLNDWNNGNKFRYALCCIDIFTRKSWAVPMPKKTQIYVNDAFNKILEEVNNDNTTNYVPKLLMSDQDSTFMSSEFQDILDRYEITFDAYIKGDHSALGIIDSFARRLKLSISKAILITHNKISWDVLMETIIKNYNNTPNTSLDGITPNDAHLKDNAQKIFLINLQKRKGKQVESDLIKGDRVRISLAKTAFTKSSSPQFSDAIYTVEFTNGSNIDLDNGKTYKRISLLKVVSSAQPIVVNPMKQNANNKKTNLELQQIDQVNRVVDVSQTPAQTIKTRTDRKQKIIQSM